MAVLRQRSAGYEDEATALIVKAGFRQPTPLQRKAIPLILGRRDVTIEAGEQSGKTIAMLATPLLALRAPSGSTGAVILVGDAEELRKIQRQARNLARAASSQLLQAVLGIDEGIRREARLLEQHPGLLMATPERLIDHIRQGNVDLAHVQYLAIDAPPDAPDFHRDVEFIRSKCPAQCQTVTFVRTLDEEPSARGHGGRQKLVLRATEWQIEEPPAGDPQKVEPDARSAQGGSAETRHSRRGNRRTEVSTEPMDNGETGASVSEEALKAAARSYLERIAQEGKPQELRRMKRIYRASVPLGLRGSLAAFLLRELSAKSGIAPSAATGRSGRSGRSGPSSRTAQSAPAVPGNIARLFMNVGRNRRVFPNDILELLTSQLAIKRSEIGEVRVLDNYSFVEIQSRHAARAVAELTGKELKGKKLTVDYARPREGKKRE